MDTAVMRWTQVSMYFCESECTVWSSLEFYLGDFILLYVAAIWNYFFQLLLHVQDCNQLLTLQNNKE